MKTETVVLLAIGGAAIAASLIYYAKQKQPKQVNPLAAPTNGNPNNNSAPVNSTSADVVNYVKAGGDALAQAEQFFGW